MRMRWGHCYNILQSQIASTSCQAVSAGAKFEPRWNFMNSDYHDSAFRIHLWHFPPTLIPLSFFDIFGLSHLWRQGWHVPRSAGVAADIFALGLVLLEATGHDPWDFQFSQGVVGDCVNSLWPTCQDPAKNSPCKDSLRVWGDAIDLTRFQWEKFYTNVSIFAVI